MTTEPRDKLTETSRVEAIARKVSAIGWEDDGCHTVLTQEEYADHYWQDSVPYTLQIMAADPATPLLAEAVKVLERLRDGYPAVDASLFDALLLRLRKVGA